MLLCACFWRGFIVCFDSQKDQWYKEKKHCMKIWRAKCWNIIFRGKLGSKENTITGVSHFSRFADRSSRYNCVKKNNLMHYLFWVYFINLYMFRVSLGPSSGGKTVCMQHLVLIILIRWLSFVLVGLVFQSNQHNRQSPKNNN